MVSNSEIMMARVLHEAAVREATAYSEHRYTARLAASNKAKASQPAASGWKVWSRLGASRRGRKPA